MTIVAMRRKCPVCKRVYSFNPSVGMFRCPYCGEIGKNMIKKKDERKKDK